MRKLLMSTALAVMALPALAEDAALLLGNERYRTLDRFVGGADVARVARDFAEAGYAVDALSNQPVSEMRQMLTRFQSRSEDADRLVVAMSGRFVTDGTRSWMLSVNAAQPTLFGIEEEGLSVESVLKVLAGVPGQSILLLALDADEDRDLDNVIREGIGTLDIPQGVAVIVGDPRNLTKLIEDAILSPNADIIEAVARNRRLRLFGYQPNQFVMQRDRVRENSTSARPYVVDRVAENLSWGRAVSDDTVESYRIHLRGFPNGTHTADANAAIQSILAEPNRTARLNEDGLSLSRDQRRAIQRDLTVLGYNTRGVDGIFGNGTRAAISNWQQENGFSQSGYVTIEQVTRINAQAARRSAQLEAEAAREREAQVRLDRAFWDETGSNGREPGLRSYLERYPDGVFSELATKQLAKIEEGKLAKSARDDREAWTVARTRDSVQSYQSYLSSQRQGSFRSEAASRLNELQRDQANSSNRGQARAQEDALGLNRLTRQLIERRLSQLGFDLGDADGRFDKNSRQAIRQFQRSRNIDPTGFISQSDLGQLLIPGRN